jgi:hypothetical protein
MKRYIFEFVIEEGDDEFWNDINDRGVTGCEEVLEVVTVAFDNEFEGVRVKLVKFEDKE